jgi:hypothetical protein
MPTPTYVFAEVAARYGGVDAGDMEAVQHWYEETLPSLPPQKIEEILDELMGREGLRSEGDGPRVYPKAAPLPTLDQAAPVPLPLLAGGWREFLRRLLQRHST